MNLVAIVIVVGLFVAMAAMQLLVRSRAKAMTGKAVPKLAGPLGFRIAGSARALVYFFSPSCGACLRLTPQFRALSQKNPSVFTVDVSRDGDLARGLNVMATPSVVEIADGVIVGFHVGVVPAEVMARFAQ